MSARFYVMTEKIFSACDYFKLLLCYVTFLPLVFSSFEKTLFPDTELLFLSPNASRKTFNHKLGFNPKVTEENQHEILLKRVTPFYKVPYGYELEVKQNNALRVVDALLERLRGIRTEINDFPVEPIRPSPVRGNYRNKDDFSIYYGADGDQPTVGYLTGTPAKYGCKAVSPISMPHVKESHKRLAVLFQDYVRRSPHKACYWFKDGGFWKRFVVRSNEAGDLMVIVVTHPGLSPAEIAVERANLTSYLLSYEPNLIIYHQECEKVDCTYEIESYIQLSGRTPYLEETMGGLKFQISPHSFFQINKKAAEGMAISLLSQMQTTDQTTLLDLYCGVGLYSVLGSRLVNNSIGIEYLVGAVDDARKNAELNQITNSEFIAGKVEKTLYELLKTKLQSVQDFAVMVNPGRAGTTKKVAEQLRRDKRIKRLTYVSCKPDNPHTFNNFVQLCRRNTQIAPPFKIKRIQLYDLFPMTAHYEMVLELER